MTDSDPSNISGKQPRPEASAKPARTSSRFSIWGTLQTVISVGVVVATLFTLWTPENLFSNRLLEQMLVSIQPTPGSAGSLPTPTESPRPRIGIVAGHAGNDSGSVCADGLTEAQVNMKIATLVQQDLVKEGYDVDLLQEFDSRLSGYHGLALISIHNDSCDYVNDEATGFKVAAAMSNPHPEKATRLTACLVQRYQAATNMRYHYNTITDDMTQYHAFSEINNQTTAAIIETGFLNLDRQILVEQSDKVAQGITAGILCFIRNEDVPTQALPTP